MRILKKDHKHIFKDLGEYQWCKICGTLRRKTHQGKQQYLKPKNLREIKQAKYLESLKENGISTKVCSSCGKEKPFTAFGKENLSIDRLRHSCKSCFREYYKKNREKNLAWQKAIPLETRMKYIQKYDDKNPEKKKARVLVNKALYDGELSKPKHCTVCGKEEKLDGHHEDYNKPLEVDWLCRACHKHKHFIKNQEHD